MRTCTWAPTTFQGTQVVTPAGESPGAAAIQDVAAFTGSLVARYEALGLTDLLIAQRWWGSGSDIEGSSLDCLAMTAFFAAHTQKLRLITAIHPGFFQPAATAKWGATIDQLTGGRWAINVTSGWNLDEFHMYGVDPLTHDERYARSSEFITLLRRAWAEPRVDHSGRFYTVEGLQMQPRPGAPLEVFQGGQSPAAIHMAATHSDWMFLNGGSEARVGSVIDAAREACRSTGRSLRFAMYAAPLCRATDEQAWAEIDARLARVDAGLVKKRHERLRKGAQGMWNEDDPLSVLDTNEGYAARLIGSPDTVLRRIEVYRALGVDMLHLDIRDKLFQSEVLPFLQGL